MCIIVTKEKNAKPLDKATLGRIWDNNPDGAGILYNDGKSTTLVKGIMTKEDFMKKVKNANKKECSFLIHTRIATHGSVKPENTHPFVSKNIGFAHNGTFNLVPMGDKTDSETFFLWTIADKTFEWCRENKFLLDMATDGCRCCIFDMQTGDMLHLCKEDWKEDKEYQGYMFSNGSYKEPRLSSWKGYSSGYGSYGSYGSSYNDYDLDELDDYASYNNSFKKSDFKKQNVFLPGLTMRKELVIDKEVALYYLADFAVKQTNNDKTELVSMIKDISLDISLAKKETDNDKKVNALTVIRSFLGVALKENYTSMVQVWYALEQFTEELDSAAATSSDILLQDEIMAQIEGYKKYHYLTR